MSNKVNAKNKGFEANNEQDDSSEDAVKLTAHALGEITDPEEVSRLEKLLESNEACHKEFQSTMQLGSFIRDHVESDLPLSPASLHDAVAAELSNGSLPPQQKIARETPESPTPTKQSPGKVTTRSQGHRWLNQRVFSAVTTLSLLLVCVIVIQQNWSNWDSTPIDMAKASPESAFNHDSISKASTQNTAGNGLASEKAIRQNRKSASQSLKVPTSRSQDQSGFAGDLAAGRTELHFFKDANSEPKIASFPGSAGALAAEAGEMGLAPKTLGRSRRQPSERKINADSQSDRISKPDPSFGAGSSRGQKSKPFSNEIGKARELPPNANPIKKVFKNLSGRALAQKGNSERSKSRQDQSSSNNPAQSILLEKEAEQALLNKRTASSATLPTGKQKSLAQESELRKLDKQSGSSSLAEMPGSTEDSEAETLAEELDDQDKPSSSLDDVSRHPKIDPLLENEFIQPIATNAISTFSIDTDTASYTNVRQMLRAGQKPHPEEVRIEEMINYFDYNYKQPKAGEQFSVSMEVASSPWSPANRLLKVGLQARKLDNRQRPPSNLVFLIDVSGSMRNTKKLPLLKKGLTLMVNRLREDDYVSIVTYATGVKILLEPTDGSQKSTIKSVIDSLVAQGSTNGGEGLQTAYRLAEKHLLKEGTNRIVMGTDGDFNLGITDHRELTALVKTKAQSGVFLTICGVGTDNFQDQKAQIMAQNGNGKVYYIDSEKEAKRVFADRISGSLVTIAKDVKLQLIFNPRTVQSYRLIGYENRMLGTRDFDDDSKDAGEMDAGDNVTAIYEI
ncbi:MAG: von Willebrand factor type A domain-containing protein, partial [Planctomycetota bacterium]|nr:von Willebrand factor type A domain-containing protein [Planctomycetota bacterium]